MDSGDGDAGVRFPLANAIWRRIPARVRDDPGGGGLWRVLGGTPLPGHIPANRGLLVDFGELPLEGRRRQESCQTSVVAAGLDGDLGKQPRRFCDRFYPAGRLLVFRAGRLVLGLDQPPEIVGRANIRQSKI